MQEQGFAGITAGTEFMSQEIGQECSPLYAQDSSRALQNSTACCGLVKYFRICKSNSIQKNNFFQTKQKIAPFY